MISPTQEELNKTEGLALAASLEDKFEHIYKIYLEVSALINKLPDTDKNKVSAVDLRNKVIDIMKTVFEIESSDEMVKLLDSRNKNNGL